MKTYTASYALSVIHPKHLGYISNTWIRINCDEKAHNEYGDCTILIIAKTGNTNWIIEEGITSLPHVIAEKMEGRLWVRIT
jgi:hypothetical protein